MSLLMSAFLSFRTLCTRKRTKTTGIATITTLINVNNIVVKAAVSSVNTPTFSKSNNPCNATALNVFKFFYTPKNYYLYY